MKKLLIAVIVLGSFSVFAQDQKTNILDCTKKAETAAYAVAQLELGENCVIVDSAQDSTSTQMTLQLTVREPITSSIVRPKELVYEVKTVDLHKSHLCIISSVKLKYSPSK